MRSKEIKYSFNSSEKLINKIQILLIWKKSPRQDLIQPLRPWQASATSKIQTLTELELKRYHHQPFWLQHSKRKPHYLRGHQLWKVLFTDKWRTTNPWNLSTVPTVLKNYLFQSIILSRQASLMSLQLNPQDQDPTNLHYWSTLKSQSSSKSPPPQEMSKLKQQPSSQKDKSNTLA